MQRCSKCLEYQQYIKHALDGLAHCQSCYIKAIMAGDDK